MTNGTATVDCPFCGYPIPMPLRQGAVTNGQIEIIADTAAVELHIRYCAKNPEATPI